MHSLGAELESARSGMPVLLTALSLLACGSLLATAHGQEAISQLRTLDAGESSVAFESPRPVTPAPAWNATLLPYRTGIVVESDCFANAEVAVVFPHLSSVLTAPVPLGDSGLSRVVTLRNTGLNTTVSPQFQIGAFRLGPGYGELAISYRLLASEGNDYTLGPGDAEASHVRSRLNYQAFNFDYVRNDSQLNNNFLLSWNAGGRLQVVFFDTQVHTPNEDEQARNFFFGAGPHAGTRLTHALGNGLCVYGDVDAALIVGYNTTQNFSLTLSDAQNGVLSGTAHQEQTQLSPSFALTAGLTWTPQWFPASQLRGGYRFEQWYSLGRVGASRGDLNAHSLFLSLEVGY